MTPINRTQPLPRQATGHYTLDEILSQPQAWTAALEVMQENAPAIQGMARTQDYTGVVFTGCGSTYYLSLAAAALFQELTSLPARGLPASEIWLYPRSSYISSSRTLLVAVSRSGETTETLRACEAFARNGGGDVLTLSCYPDRALPLLGKLNLVFPSAQEESIAQTRAFSTLYLATVAFAMLWTGRNDLLAELTRLPGLCQNLITNYHSLARSLATDPALDRFYILGSGLRYGLACELSLKMKEMSLSHSEPFHFMEFRHGPKSMVTQGTLMVGLISESNQAYERAVLEDVKAMGARQFTFGDSDTDVVFHSGISEIARNVLCMPIGQLLAYERSLHNGLNPDRPNNLDTVVRL